MKSLLLTFFLATQLFAQNANVDRETALQNELMRNSALSQQYQQQAAAQSGAPAPRTTINPTMTNPGTNNTGMNLTDQDKQLSENYVNQAGANKILQKECTGEDNEKICAGRAASHTSAGIDSQTGEMVAKAYALFSGMAGGQLTIKAVPAGKLADGTPTKAVDEHKEDDYCKYIPTVTETLATFSQQQSQQNMNSVQNADSAQKDSLLKAAKAHDEHSKMAKVQSYGWLGGAACYAGMIAFGGAAVDWKIGAKIGAGVFLGAFYTDEASKYDEYANKTRAIANSLPGKGDCNPITQKSCYCAQKENQAAAEYGQYCNPPGLHNSVIAKTSYRVACTDNKMQIDPACNCKNTNSCFDQFLGNQKFGGSLGIGTMNGGPLADVRSLSKGELTGANISGGAGGPALALAKKAMAELSSKLPPNQGMLNPNQNAFANTLMGKGIPGELARSMASQNIPAGALSSAMAKFQGATFSPAPAVGARSNVLDFSGGRGLGIGGNTDSGRRSNDSLAKFVKKSGPSANVLEFAAKAEAQAKTTGQIRQNDASLFEVISNRYQQSGRRLLEVDTAQ